MTTIVTIGYFYQCFKNLKLPFIQTNQNSNVKENSMITNPRKDITLVIFGIAFMFLSYGIDMYFQSQIYVFGLCGPLKLSPGIIHKPRGQNFGYFDPLPLHGHFY